jgi:ATP-dependent RNA helicase DeaD
VVHADLPLNAESLTHRSGRTGRAGRKGQSVVIADPAERRKAERLLATAKATFTWSPAPTAEAIAEASRRRLEEELLAATLPEDAEEARGLARRLLKEHKKEDLLELLLARELARCPVGVPLKAVDPKYLARAPRNEPFADLPPRRKRADFERDAVVFRVNLGADQKAEPGWLLPLICRRGGVTRNEVGAIRVGPTSSEFQIAGDAARDFALAASRPDPRAPHVVIESSQARAPRPPQGDEESGQARAPRPAYRGRDSSQARGPYPSRDGAEPARPPRPAYRDAEPSQPRAPRPAYRGGGEPTPARGSHPPRDGVAFIHARTPRPQYGKPQRADGRSPLPRWPEHGKPMWKPRPKPGRG